MKRLRRLVRRVRERVEDGAVILMYHRVAELQLDPWGLAVPPGNFEAHLRAIRSMGRPMSLGDLSANLKTGRIVAGSVAVTFDDGYLDNLTDAKPLLERYEIPATIFITSGKIGVDREFWWDELEQVILVPEHLPDRLELALPREDVTWTLGAATRYGKEERTSDRSLLLWDARPGSRLALYRDLYALLRKFAVADRDRAMKALAVWAGVQRVNRESHRTVSSDELRTLADGGLIEIGAHSRTHTFLSNLSAEEQEHEILGSRQDLERALARSIVSFAYPHGDAPREALASARKHVDHALTTDARPTLVGDDPWALPRFGVPDCDGPDFAARFLARS